MNEYTSSQINTIFDGWHAGRTILLDNGTAWQLMDEPERPRESPPVATILQDEFGRFFIHVEGQGMQEVRAIAPRPSPNESRSAPAKPRKRRSRKKKILGTDDDWIIRSFKNIMKAEERGRKYGPHDPNDPNYCG